MKSRIVAILFALWLVVPFMDLLNFAVGRYTEIPAYMWVMVASAWNALSGLWFWRKLKVKRGNIV